MINIKSVRRQLILLFDARYVFTYISIYSKDNLELRSWIKQRDHLNNAWKRKTLEKQTHRIHSQEKYGMN